MNFSITNALAQAPETLKSAFASTSLSAREERLLSALQKAYPNNAVRLARQTPVPHLFEVILGTGVSYVFVDDAFFTQPDNTDSNVDYKRFFRYWLFGGIFFDMTEQKDLTAPAKAMAQMIDVGELPLKNAVVRQKGTGENILYVFTDPQCPFCEQLEKTLAEMTDITIYTFLTPLVSLHPASREVASSIWCAANPAKALEEVMLKRKTLAPAQCTTPILENEALMKTLAIKGTPTLFLENGERITGAPDKERLSAAFEKIRALKAKLQNKELK